MHPESLLRGLAERIARLPRTTPQRVGIDGVDGAGKTSLADALVAPLSALGRTVLRSSVDSFHRPREERYARGKASPEGYFRDSFDYPRVRELLLEPLAGGGSREIRRAYFDHRTDSSVDAPIEAAPRDAVLLFDGIFLARPELEGCFELRIYVKTPVEVACRRTAERDGGDPDPEAQSNRRYVAGQRIYHERCDPEALADIVVDGESGNFLRGASDG